MSVIDRWPLEMVLRISGQVDVLDAQGATVWTSDGDLEFWEYIETDFVEESDVDEVIDYLQDAKIITDDEKVKFDDDEFDVIIEEPADGGVNDEDEDENEEM